MFATVSEELLSVFRREVDDAVAPYLWSDAEAYGYMTEAFDALLKKSDIVMKVLSLRVVAGQNYVSIPAKLLEIHSANIDGQPLTQKNTNDPSFTLQDDYGVFRNGASALFDSDTTGTPEYYVRDYQANALRLVPVPNANAVLEVQGRVTLGAAMEEGAALPSTDAQDLRAALHYMKHLAYQKHDSATEDLDRSRFHLDHYTRLAEMREQQLKNNRRAPGFIRMEW